MQGHEATTSLPAALGHRRVECVSRQAQAAACCRDVRDHCHWRHLSRQQAFGLAVFVVMFGLLIILSSLGYLQLLSDLIVQHFGPWGHAIFALLIVSTGLPFGYGWSLFVIAAGYALGWPAVASSFGATIVGHFLGFFVSRRCLQASVMRKVGSLPEGWQRRIHLVQDAVTSSVLTYLFLTGLLRNCGALTFGLNNAIDAGCTRIPWRTSLLGVVVASGPGLVVNTYIGTLVSSLFDTGTSSAVDATGRNITVGQAAAEKAGRDTAIIVQLILAGSFLVCSVLYARYRLSKITSAAAAPVKAPEPDHAAGA